MSDVTVTILEGRLPCLASSSPRSPRPLTADAIFWIASMTKPIAAAAILMMQKEGKLSLDDSVEKQLPESARLKTVDGKHVKPKTPASSCTRTLEQELTAKASRRSKGPSSKASGAHPGLRCALTQVWHGEDAR